MLGRRLLGTQLACGFSAGLFAAACGGPDSAREPNFTVTAAPASATSIDATTTPKTSIPSPSSTIVATVSAPPTTNAPSLPTVDDQAGPAPETDIGPSNGSPSCDAATLANVWNQRFDGDFPLELGPYELTDAVCDNGVATGFVSQSRDDLGNPDFGQAVFIAGPNGWTAVGRVRAPTCDTEMRLIESYGMDSEAAQAAARLMQVEAC